MTRFITVVFGVFLMVLSPSIAVGQTQSGLWEKISSFSQAEADGDTVRAADLAAELANVDFTLQGFTFHEAGELRASFVTALFEAGRYDHATGLLDAITTGDKAVFDLAENQVEKAYYRNVVIERLEHRAEIAKFMRDGDAQINALSKMHQLKLDVLAPGHPELMSVTDQLLGHLGARARWRAETGAGKIGVQDLKLAYNIAGQSFEPSTNKQIGIQNEIRAMTDRVADELVAKNDLDGAINWLEGENASAQTDFQTIFIDPYANKLASLYRNRAALSRRVGNYTRAIADLRTSRRLDRTDDVTRELAITLLESARLFQSKGQNERAYRDATEAAQLRVSDPLLQADIDAVRERAYRDWQNIPDDHGVNYPLASPSAPYGAVYTPATSQITTIQLPPFREVRVFYGTNRDRRSGKYSRHMSPVLEYGWAKVTVPEDRNPGDIPRPFPGFRAKDSKHIILKNTTPYSGVSEFGRKLKSSLSCADLFFFEDDREPECVAETSKKSELFVFIHGHNVPFKNAAMRTAQLAVDLDMEHGAVFFAWPTGRHALDYWRSRENADASYHNLVSFLETVTRESDADEIHLIAHSMGNRVLLNALKEIKTRSGDKTLFDQIIFGSPDVDESEFVATVKDVESLGNSMTLYGSDKDKALKLSAKLPDNEKRAGLSPPSAQIINASTKLTFIDTSDLERRFKDVIDHADFTAGAFNDVRGVVWTGEAPQKRCALAIERLSETLAYWKAQTRKAKCQMQDYGKNIVAMRKQNTRPIIRRLSETLFPTRPRRPTLVTREDK